MTVDGFQIHLGLRDGVRIGPLPGQASCQLLAGREIFSATFLSN